MSGRIETLLLDRPTGNGPKFLSEACSGRRTGVHFAGACANRLTGEFLRRSLHIRRVRLCIREILREAVRLSVRGEQVVF